MKKMGMMMNVTIHEDEFYGMIMIMIIITNMTMTTIMMTVMHT